MFAAAIDGPAGAGKSSVARAAARELGFLYVDTGALYRAIALYMLEHQVDTEDPQAVEAALGAITVDIGYRDGEQQVFLLGENVTGRIRTQEVSEATSVCAGIPAVRAFLLELQRDMARRHSVLVDGRDIGTVVLPNAQLKVFLTASAEVRAHRRLKQLEEAGQPGVYEQILEEIRERDHRDSHRETAPLKQAADAVLLDTSHLSFDEAVAALVALVRARQ